MTGRRALLLLPLLAAGCADDAPLMRVFTPLRYDYLTPLRLNVAALDVAPAPPTPGDAQSPAPLGEVMRRMGTDRLAASGTTGRAVFTVDEASVVRTGGTLAGRATVRLEVFGADGARGGFASASVQRRVAGIGRGAALQAALYDLSRQMGDDMNVEFEFQVRRTLRDFLQVSGAAPPPAPVERQDLQPPAVPGAPAEPEA